MIELLNVSKYYPTEFGRHYVFRDVSLRLPLDKSVGVLGPNGAGKSTFLRLLGGADIPSAGKIIKTGRISPPMGLTPGLQSSLTAAENARFAGRIHDLSRDEIADMIEHVRELANIGKYFEMPVGTYSAGMKQRVAFAINMSIDFDYYLFDEISAGGDREFRKITDAMVEQRIKTSKFIIASHRVEDLLDVCDSGIVLQKGVLTFFEEIKDALEFYGEIPVKKKGKRDSAVHQSKQAAGKDAAAVSKPIVAQQPATDRKPAKTEQLPPAREAKRGMTNRPAKSRKAAPTAAESPGETREARLEHVRAKRKKLRLARAAKRGQADKPARARKSERAAAEAAAETRETSLKRTPAGRKKLRQDRQRTRREAATGSPDQTRTLALPSHTSAAAALPRHDAARTDTARGKTNRNQTRRKPAVSQRLERRRRQARNIRADGRDAPAMVDRQQTSPAPPPAAAETGIGLTPHRVALSQERAQVKSARALRMLLQHLESQAGSGDIAQAASRAALVAAAQESAAAEASVARAVFDTRETSTTAGPPAPTRARRSDSRPGHSNN